MRVAGLFWKLSRVHLRPGSMELNVVVHEAVEGGYWAEIPAIPGCATQGETLEELWANVSEAVEGCFAVGPRECSEAE